MSSPRCRRPAGWLRVSLCLCIAAWLACLLPSLALAQVTHGPPRIRNVYIPADQLQVLFDSTSKGVLMPREKALALWREARQRAASPTVPPADAVVSQATYDARLGDHELRISGRLDIAKLRGDWQTVDLPFGGVTIESAQFDGEPARLGRRDDGTLFLVLKREGRLELKLEMSAPLVGKGGDLATTLKLPPVPASEMTIRLDKGKQLQVGQTTLQPDGSDDGQQRFRVAVDPTGLLPLVVSDRFAAGSRAPLVFAASRSICRIEPAGLSWEVLLDLDVYARQADTFRLQLPDSVDVTDVEAAQLRQWTLDKQPGGTATVTLTFHKSLLGRRSVRLCGLAPFPMATKWHAPTLKVFGAASHVGQVVVCSSPSLRVEVGELTGIRPERVSLAAASLPSATGDPPLTFAFWDQDFTLPLQVEARRQAVQASVASLVEVGRAGLTLRSSVKIESRHAPVFAVQLQLTRDWDVTSVLAADQPVEWELLDPADGGTAADRALQTVRFDLASPLHPGDSLEVSLAAERHPDNWLEEGEKFSELPIPELRPAAADEIEGTLLLRASPDIDLLVSNVSDDLQPVAADASRGASQAGGTALEYRYQDDARISGRLQARAVPAKVSAETLAFARLDRGKLEVHYQLDLDVRQGKLRRIRFTLPAAVGEKIRIVPIDSAARVIEQQHGPSRVAQPDASAAAGQGGGEVYPWQIVLDRPVTGDLTLALDFEQTLSRQAASRDAVESASGESASATAGAAVPIPVLAFEDVSRQGGIVAVEAAGDQQIDCQPENLRDLDPADVSKPKGYVPGQRIVAAYRYTRLPYGLTLTATRHASEPVLAAICESAEITSVAGRQGRMRHQARFRLRSLNQQQVPVTLPENADLWSVVLDNEPVEVRRQHGTYVVPLPAGRAGSAGGVRDLTLLYETAGPRLDGRRSWERLWSEAVRQSTPEIGMTTLGTTWYVYPPDGTELVSSGGGFKPATRLSRPTLVSRLAETIADHGRSALWWKIGGLVAAAVVAGFFALIRTGTKGRFTVVELFVVFVVLGLLIALLLPSVQSAREAGRRAQCLNNLKQIGLALHSYHDVYGQFPPAVIGPAGLPPERQFSWIVAILPYIEQTPLYDALRLDLPWDDPYNAALLQTPLDVVRCPADMAPTATYDGFPKTSYVVVTGADLTDGSGGTRGVIGFDSGLRLDDIADGASNTVMVAEVTDGGPWFAGGAGTARPIDGWIENKTWSQHPGGGNFLFADGSVQFVNSTADSLALQHLATAQGNDRAARDDLDVGVAAGAAPAAMPEESPAPAESAPAAESPPVMGRTPPQVPTPVAEGKEEAARAAAPQPASESKPSPQVARQPVSRRGRRARLSLRVALETQGGQAIRFRRESGPGDLVLGLQDRSFAHTLQWLAVAALLLAAWIWRRAPGAKRAIAFVVGLALPIGLSGLVPLAWTPLLDGLLLGTLAAGALWTVLRIIAGVKTPVPGSAAAALAIGISVLLATGAGAADETRPAQQAQPSSGSAAQPNLTLFIPYSPGDANPLDNTQVYLPHDEFLRLWKEARPDKPAEVAPDVRAVVSHAEYTGQLQGDVARFDGRLVIHHLDDGWVSVALPLGRVALEKIEINGQPAALANDDRAHSPQASPPDGAPSAIYLQQPGLHVVDVRFSVPVRRLGATGHLTVPLRPVPSGRLVFELPAEGLDVQVTGCPGGWRRQGPPSRAIGIPLGAADELSIRWQPQRVEAREGQLVSVDQAMLIEVLDSGVHFYGKLHYRIQQGALSKLRLRIPPDMAVQRVHGDEVADWSIEPEPAAGPDPAAQQLVVTLKTELTTGTDVNIDGFRRDRPATGSVDVLAPEPLGVVRETGRMAIGASSRFRVRVGRTSGVDQIDRAGLDLPQSTSDGCALLAAYRYTARPWHVELQIERRRARVEVADRTAVAVTARQAALRSLLSVQITGSPVASLTLRLPASLRVSQVRVPPGADWFLDRDGQRRQLKVKLPEPAIGKLDVALTGTLARDSSQAEFHVPGVTVEEADAQRGQLAVYVDDDLEAVLANDGGARSVDPAALDGVLQPDAARPVHYAFRYESPPKELRLRLSPAPSHTSAEVTTVVSVREGAVAYVSKVDFEIRQAGRRRFRLLTPDWLGDDLEVQGDELRRVRSQPTDRGRTWDIELQQPVRGSYRLQLTQTLPLADDGTVRAAIIRPLDVERSRNHVVLENATADEIAPATTSGAEPISIAEVPEGLAESIRRQAVAAYRIHDDAAELVWKRHVRQQETGPMASISLADLTTVVDADGRYRARAAYNIRNLTLQFLELKLPPDARVWSVHVSDQFVRPATIRRQGQTTTLLPLEKTSAGDFSSKVVVIYSGRLGKPLHRWTLVSPLAPQIVSDIPVSRTLWTLYLPPEYRASLVNGESNLEEVAAAYQQEERKLSFLDEMRQMVQVASSKSKSAARTKAQNNLKQIGLALHNYARQGAQADAKNAADVQEQAQQIEAEIRRLEESKTDTERVDRDTSRFFDQVQQRPAGGQAGVDLDGALGKLPELSAPEADKVPPKGTQEKMQGAAQGRPEERRGELRRQAAEQLKRLQTFERKEPGQQKQAAPEGEQAPQVGQAARGAAEPAAGHLSVDWDATLVGTAYHFRKLHGEPRLVVRARHESLGRILSAIVWAGLCLALATAVVHVLRRPDAAALASRGWPWLAAVAGAAWLFLLPGGVFGLVLLVTAWCVLIARRQTHQP